MADLPGNTSRSSTGGLIDHAIPAESTVPTWMAARRARVPSETASDSAATVVEPELEVEFVGISDEPVAASEDDTVTIVTADSAVKLRSTAKPPATTDRSQPPVASAIAAVPVFRAAPREQSASTPDSESAVVVSKSVTRLRARRDSNLVKTVVVKTDDDPDTVDNSLRARLLRLGRSATMAGVLVSMLVHTVVVAVLAVLVIGGPSVHRALDIFGAMGDPNDSESLEIDLDSSMPIDPGKEAAPIEFPDTTQMVSSEKAAFDPSDSIRGLPGGSGTGSGSGGGEGDAVAMPAVKIPGYAVTKGSFSAWTEPRDPAPGISYEIVIQFRLPQNVTTYRGSDLTGMVIGTDGYKQVIRFRRGESFEVQDGSVQVRIRVPGADRLVRDTIRVESKLLHEKQLIEIEF